MRISDWSSDVCSSDLKKALTIIAVGSGKGGVGKSTLAANLAVALRRRGVKVGLVDADIYGPSLPKLLDSEGTKPEAQGSKLVPVPNAYGVPMLSTDRKSTRLKSSH